MSKINLQNNNIEYLNSYDTIIPIKVCNDPNCTYNLCNEIKNNNNTIIEVINDKY